MESLYHQTNRLLQDVQGDLVKLESANRDIFHIVENEIQAHIDHIYSNCERLDILVNKEPPQRRPTAKIRVDQIKYDCQHLQSAVRNIQHKRYMRDEEDREREELLSRNFTTNDTAIYMDEGLQHNTRLNNANNDMDDLIGSGTSVLGSLRDQRLSLKNAHKKILDVTNMLGLSNTVMRLIEKRTSQDKIVLFGGMIATCVIIVLVVIYLL